MTTEEISEEGAAKDLIRLEQVEQRFAAAADLLLVLLFEYWAARVEREVPVAILQLAAEQQDSAAAEQLLQLQGKPAG